MTPEIIEWATRVRDSHRLKGLRVLEIGSRDVNGTARSVFQAHATEYVGVDLEPGPGVDLVGDGAAWIAYWQADPRGAKPFELAICAETLEHVEDPIRLCIGMKAILSEGGWMILTSPGPEFPVHRFPLDCWRILPDGYEKVLLKGMQVVDHYLTGDPCHCYLARKA